MNSLLQLIGSFGAVLQERLFPAPESEPGTLSPQHEQFVAVLGMLGMENALIARGGPGRPPHDRLCIARAFVAKALFGMPTTRVLPDRPACDHALRRLCGWETAAAIPDETVFSRAFAAFAATGPAQRIHEKMIEGTQAQRLIGPIVRDSTAMEYGSARKGAAEAEGGGAGPEIAPQPVGQAQSMGKDDEGGTTVLRQDDAGTDAGRIAESLRRGL